MQTFSINHDVSDFWMSLTKAEYEAIDNEWFLRISENIANRVGKLGARADYFTDVKKKRVKELNAYAAKSKRNEIYKDTENCVPIVYAGDVNDGEVPAHCVFESALGVVDENFAKLFEEDDIVSETMTELLDLREYFRLEKRVDLFALIKVASKGCLYKDDSLLTVRANKAMEVIKALGEEFNCTAKLINMMRVPGVITQILAYDNT